ncbi:hypothetical protein HZ994_17130 [Akkermansiaceae bacterium]|nr:hypothetical protein HZ994_17130 [Akkermansiaceae bacterium]
MKILLAALLLLPAWPALSAESNARLVSVSPTLETIRNDAKRERTETVGYKLAIDLRAATSVVGELKVVTVFFAKKLPGNDTIERNSTRTVTIGPNHTASLASATEKFTHTREYEVRIETKKKPGTKKRPPVRYKTIPASGEKYSGWAVRVYQGNNLIGEEASASHLRISR